jgi:iron complex outermembrane receptor protein
MRPSLRLKLRLAVGVAAAAIMVQPALAQPGGEPPVASGEEASPDIVIVTGIGPARTAEELIASTTVLQADDVTDRLSGGLGDTLNGLPGVTSTAFGPGASRPVIRGLGAERVQVLTNGVGVIDASSASPDHAVTGDPLGAERIEILRGPATLAYGGGALGGVVNVIDGLIQEARPAQAFSAAGYAGYTSVDDGRTGAARVVASVADVVGVLSWTGRDAGDLEIPGYAESARLRALEEEEGEEHAQQDPGLLGNSFVETRSLSGGLSFVGETGFFGISVRQSESIYGIVGGHHHHDEPSLALLPVSVAAPLSLAIAGAEEEEEPFIDLEQTRYEMRGGWMFSQGPVKRITGSLSLADYQHIEFEAPGEPGTVFNNEGYEARIEVQHADIMGLAGSLGLQSSRRDFRAIGDEAFVTPTITEQSGVFIFETYEQGDWGLEGGIRFDEVRLDNILAGERSFETLNASFGVHGHLTPQLFLGATVNRAERAPTDVELFADGPHLATQQYEVGDTSLTTERGLSLEVSARWEEGPLEIGASLYQFTFDDFIYLVPTGEEDDDLPVFLATQNDAEFTGAEFTLRYDLGEGFGARWAFDGAVDMVRGALDTGGSLPRIPPASAVAGLEAETELVSARLEARWSDDQTRVTNFELPTDGWTVLDLTTTWHVSPGIDLILAGTNLTDEEVRLHASPLKDLAPMGGRSLRVGLRADF